MFSKFIGFLQKLNDEGVCKKNFPHVKKSHYCPFLEDPEGGQPRGGKRRGQCRLSSKRRGQCRLSSLPHGRQLQEVSHRHQTFPLREHHQGSGTGFCRIYETRHSLVQFAHRRYSLLQRNYVPNYVSSLT